IDVQISDWDCTVEPDGAIRLGLRYVSGLRQQVGKAIAMAGLKTCATHKTGVAQDIKTGVAQNGKTGVAQDIKTGVVQNGKTGVAQDFSPAHGSGLRTLGSRPQAQRPTPDAQTPACPKCGCDDRS